MKVVNMKNKKTYEIVADRLINATNENKGQIMVIYHDKNKIFVREIDEFWEKFKIKE